MQAQNATLTVTVELKRAAVAVHVKMQQPHHMLTSATGFWSFEAHHGTVTGPRLHHIYIELQDSAVAASTGTSELRTWVDGLEQSPTMTSQLRCVLILLICDYGQAT